MLKDFEGLPKRVPAPGLGPLSPEGCIQHHTVMVYCVVQCPCLSCPTGQASLARDGGDSRRYSVTNSLGLVRVVTAVVVSVTEQVHGDTVTIPALELLSLAVEARLGGTVGLVRAVTAVLSGVTAPALQDTELAVPAEDLTSRAGDVTVSLVRAVMTVLLAVTEPVVQHTHPFTAGPPAVRADLGWAGGRLVTPV